jgi:hypothetical protein
LPSEIQSRLANDAAGKTGNMAVSMEMPSLRETRMRTTAPAKNPSPGKTADRFLNWSRFPTRVR